MRQNVSRLTKQFLFNDRKISDLGRMRQGRQGEELFKSTYYWKNSKLKTVQLINWKIL
jgi:hypothetical protein